MAALYIPVQGTEEEVRVALDSLPRDASDILDILKAEQAPLDLWLIIAREYFKQGKLEQFHQILEEGSGPEIDDYYAEVKYERIAILNALGAYHTYLGKIETRQREKDERFKTATQYYNKASRIDCHEPSTWIGKGQLFVAKGDLQQASGFFNIVLDDNPNNVPALLGQACVEFNQGESQEQYNKAVDFYKNSLKLYKRALQVHPTCPGSVRLGIALCFYRLGQHEKARQAFERVLQLDPENVEALVVLGIMDLHTNEAGGIQKGMEKMHRAFEIYPYCSVALNHLANHFFFTGQHFLVEQLSETALAASNHGLTKSISYYNLARSYHSKGDFKKAAGHYNSSINEISRPKDFVLPYYGLGQVQLMLGDNISALSSFKMVLEVHPENCESMKAVGHIYAQQGETDKAIEMFRKAARVDPRDPHAFMELGGLLISSDAVAALDALKTAHSILKKEGEEVPVELLNDIGVLYFEKGDFELAEQSFKEALGEGIWSSFLSGKSVGSAIDCSAVSLQYKDFSLFVQLEEGGTSSDLPRNKVTVSFNYARLLEQQYETEKASFMYRFILYKDPDYIDAYLRLAAIAKARNDIQSSIALVGEALKIGDKCPNALSMLGALELKNDEWVKAKDTFKAAKDATNGKDSYSILALGNWNYFAALRSEKRGANLEATHLEKAKELYTNTLMVHPGNLYAANGAGLVLAEKGLFDVSKDLFTQVQEAASSNIFVQMPDVWVNLAHIHFAQGHFALAAKTYQNCLRKFYNNTDTHILLYLARTYYEAEQWQDCKKTLLRAIHLSPSNYTLRFDAGVTLQKYSSSTLQKEKEKRTAEEVRSTIAELKNAVCLFNQLSAASSHHAHGFDEKKIETHVQYCTHLLNIAKVHYEAAERDEQTVRQKIEVARQVQLAEEAKHRAEEQKRLQAERRKQEEELRQIKQQEEHFERIKEHLKSTVNASSAKRKERAAQAEDDESGDGGKRRRKGGKKTRKDKAGKSNNGHEEEPGMDQENRARDGFAAAGLEDSDAEDNTEPSANHRRRAWSESEEEDEHPQNVNSSPAQHAEKSAGSDREAGGNESGKSNDESEDH